MKYNLKLDIFEGPLDLLLYLIKESKMDICDIPISEVTRQYLSYVEMMQELNLELAGEYLIIASELTRIKSQMLLPRDETKTDSDEEGDDPRAELSRRLIEYQRFKNVTFEFRRLEHDRQQFFVRDAKTHIEPEEEVLVQADVIDLFNAFKNVLTAKKKNPEYEIVVTSLSVEDRIHYLLDILNASETITFSSLFSVLNSKQEIIVTFLALLELIRLKLIKVEQGGHYETIRLYLAKDLNEQQLALDAHFGKTDNEDVG